jgi:hypothetical protein
MQQASLCLLFSALVPLEAAEYEVDGHLEQTLFKMDGSVQLVTRSKFTVFVKGCSWLIQTTLLDEAGKPRRCGTCRAELRWKSTYTHERANSFTLFSKLR